jgi:hypothetical protein
MFKNKEYVLLLENIMEVELLSKNEIAKHIGISYPVLLRILKADNEMEPSLQVKRKIKLFIDKYNEEHHERKV